MAEKGTYTAYQQLRPLEGDISKDLQQQEENGFRRRAEDRYKEEAEQKKKDKEAEDKKALWDKYVKPLSNYDTGSKTLNEAQGRLLIQAQKEYVPLMQVIESPNASDEDKLKATLKLQNLNNLPENLTQFTKSLTDRDIAYRKAVDSKSIYADPNYEKNFQEGYENKLLSLDENGMPLIAFRDQNGDGQNDMETYDQVKNIVDTYDIQQRFNWDADLEDASKNVKPIEVTRDNGSTTTTKTGADEGLLSDYVAGQLYLGDKSTPSPKFKSYMRDFNVDPSDTKAVAALENRYKNSIRLRVKGKDSVTQNDSALDWQKEKNSQKEIDKKNKVSYGVVTTPPAFKEAGYNSMTGYKTVAVQGKVTMPAITFKGTTKKDGKSTEKEETITNGQIQSYTVVKNGKGQRSIVAEVAYEDEKSVRSKESDPNAKPSLYSDDSGTTVTTGERKKTKIIPLTEAQADVFSRQLGFKNVNEMKDSARSGEKEEEKTKPKIDY